MIDLYDEMTSLIGALEAAGADYALCGGLAMAVWGRPRATVDIDVLVPAGKVDAAIQAARTCGFNLDAASMSFADGAVEIRRVTKVDPETKDVLPFDILIVTPSLEEAWRTRERVTWEEGDLWVVSKQGMVLLKRLRGSGQDMDDIEELLRE